MLKTIANILQQKGKTVWSIPSDAKVIDALELMAEKRIGALVVLQEDEVVGVFGERDFALKVDLHGRTSRTTTVGEVMTSDVYCVSPETPIDEAMALVTNSRSRHLPVMENDQLVGLASIGDLVKASLDDRDLVIKEMRKYIKGEI